MRNIRNGSIETRERERERSVCLCETSFIISIVLNSLWTRLQIIVTAFYLINNNEILYVTYIHNGRQRPRT